MQGEGRELLNPSSFVRQQKNAALNQFLPIVFYAENGMQWGSEDFFCIKNENGKFEIVHQMLN